MSLSFLRCSRVLLALAAPTIAFLHDGRHPATAGSPAADPGAIPGVSAPAPPPQTSAAVPRIYRAACVKCHDTDGKGEIVRDVMPKVPDFTDAAWHDTRSDAELSRSILEGKGKSMPAMRNKLGSVDVGQVVSFVRAFRGGKQVVEDEEEGPAEPQRSAEPAPADGPGSRPAGRSRPSPEDLSLRTGSRTFQRSCAACHGGDGRGGEMRGSLPEIPDFSACPGRRERTDPQLVASVLDGKGTGMPAFRDKLSREQARDLVAFIRSLGPATLRAAARPSDDFEARFRQLLTEFEDLRARSRASRPRRPRPYPARRSHPRPRPRPLTTRLNQAATGGVGPAVELEPHRRPGRAGRDCRRRRVRRSLPWARPGRRRRGGRARPGGLPPELGDRLREDDRFGEGSTGGVGGPRCPIAAGNNDLPILLAREIGLVAHVRHRHMIVAERSLAQRAGVVARAAIVLEQLAAGRASSWAGRGDARRVDRDVLPQAVVPADRVGRGGLAAGHDRRPTAGDQRRTDRQTPSIVLVFLVHQNPQTIWPMKPLSRNDGTPSSSLISMASFRASDG